MLRQTDKLFPVEVMKTDGSKVKIRYVGYADKYDKWREVEEVESPTRRCANREERRQNTHYTTFDPRRVVN